MEKEELVEMIELHEPIEIVAATITRYSVGKKFVKLFWDKEKMMWCAISRGSGRHVWIGNGIVKGVVGLPAVAEEPKPEKATKKVV